MNIPPETNDLNRDPHRVRDNICRFVSENCSWTPVADLLVRFAVPLFGIAAVALYKKSLEKREQEVTRNEESFHAAKEKLALEKALFNAEKEESLEKSTAKVINDLMASANKRSYKANCEIEILSSLIQQVLKVKCSPFTPKNEREPIEKKIRHRLIGSSPLDEYESLKSKISDDIEVIYKQDINHCDKPWPLGGNDNGLLYKIYTENWRLYIELEKHKAIIEQLKRAALQQRSSKSF